MRRIALILLLTVFALSAQEKKKKRAPREDGPQPRVVTPATTTQPPSDAVVLFNGKDMSGWVTRTGERGKCEARSGEMICATGAGDIITEDTFKDAQIHLEFAVPLMQDQKGQRRGNSGVYVHSCYEVQILDSHNNPTYADGILGAVYGFAPPLVNAGKPPEQWQTYDMIFRAPRCDVSGDVSEPGRLTVFLNGILVQDHTPIPKKGPGCRQENICDRGPMRLQDHSGFPNAPKTVMKFRNLWLRHLE